MENLTQDESVYLYNLILVKGVGNSNISDKELELLKACKIKMKACMHGIESVEENDREFVLTPAKAFENAYTRKRAARLEEVEKENERLNDVTNSANRQAALVMNENTYLISKVENLTHDWHVQYKANIEATSIIQEIVNLCAVSTQDLDLICRAKDFINNKLF